MTQPLTIKAQLLSDDIKHSEKTKRVIAITKRASVVTMTLSGAVMAITAVMIPHQVDKLIAGSVEEIGSNIGNPQYTDIIMHLMAGGKIAVIPEASLYTMVIAGLTLSYIGIYSILNKDKKKPLRHLFTLSYWLEFQQQLAYTPRKTDDSSKARQTISDIVMPFRLAAKNALKRRKTNKKT